MLVGLQCVPALLRGACLVCVQQNQSSLRGKRSERHGEMCYWSGSDVSECQRCRSEREGSDLSLRASRKFDARKTARAVTVGPS